MKELFYTSPYKIRLHTIRIEYGEIGEKFALKVFEGEINFKGDFEEKPIDAIFKEEEEMLMHLSSINSVLINGGWKLREKTDEELVQDLEEAHQALFNLRFQASTRQLEDVSQVKRARRQIARIKTLIRERNDLSDSEIGTEE